MHDGLLAGPLDPDADHQPRFARVPVAPGTAISHLAADVHGLAVRFANGRLVIRDDSATEHSMLITDGAFEVDGQRCTPVWAPAAPATSPRRTASGAVPLRHQPRVARASRILVEGIHDAELVEKVWGDELRRGGIVVERLDGLDDVAAVVRDFSPGPGRRLGILVDHLTDGSKEARLAAAVDGPHVLVTGTPYVDVWQGVRPGSIGIEAWPEVPLGEPWKQGILDRLGRTDSPGEFWRWLLGQVTSWTDLEVPLVGAVEQLIDFVLLDDQD